MHREKETVFAIPEHSGKEEKQKTDTCCLFTNKLEQQTPYTCKQ